MNESYQNLTFSHNYKSYELAEEKDSSNAHHGRSMAHIVNIQETVCRKKRWRDRWKHGFYFAVVTHHPKERRGVAAAVWK